MTVALDFDSAVVLSDQILADGQSEAQTIVTPTGLLSLLKTGEDEREEFLRDALPGIDDEDVVLTSSSLQRNMDAAMLSELHRISEHVRERLL